MKNKLYEFFTQNRTWLIYSLVSGFCFALISVQQSCRQNTLEARLFNAENKAIHRAETNYSIVISGLLQSATIIETNLIEVKNHNLILIDCAKKGNCSNEILVEKVQKPYVPIAEHYLKIQEKMIDESKEGN
jgi:hypothetical protein